MFGFKLFPEPPNSKILPADLEKVKFDVLPVIVKPNFKGTPAAIMYLYKSLILLPTCPIGL